MNERLNMVIHSDWIGGLFLLKYEQKHLQDIVFLQQILRFRMFFLK